MKTKALPKYSVNTNGVFKITTKNDEQILEKISNYITISKVMENIDTGEINLKLSFAYKGQIKQIPVSRKIFTKTHLLELQKFGVDVTDDNAKDVIKYLKNVEEKALKELIYQKLGWFKENNEIAFKHHEIISKTPIRATYCGDLNISPQGSLDIWLKMIEKEVIGYTPLEAILCIGFSSAIVSLLDEKIDGESLFFHLSGDSTTGKSTSLMLVLSIWGSPDPQKNSLFFNWNSTANALIKILKNNNGILIGIDESSVSHMEDFSSIIYQIANGREKMRMTKELSLEEVGTWKTSIISTGENSLKANSNANKGIHVRIMEFNNVKWTKNAENAEKIKSTIMQNNGHAWEPFVKKLIDVGEDEIKRRFDEKAKIIKEEYKEKRLSYRLLKKVISLLLVGELINETFAFNLNMCEVKNFLIDNLIINEEEEEDIGVSSLEYVKEYIAKNVNKFYYDSPNFSRSPIKFSEVIGRIEINNKNKSSIYIPRNKLYEILKEGKFTNPKLIINKWKDMGVLKTDKGRNTVKKKITFEEPAPVRCICINLDDKLNNDEEVKKNIKKIENNVEFKEVDDYDDEIEKLFNMNE